MTPSKKQEKGPTTDASSASNVPPTDPSSASNAPPKSTPSKKQENGPTTDPSSASNAPPKSTPSKKQENGPTTDPSLASNAPPKSTPSKKQENGPTTDPSSTSNAPPKLTPSKKQENGPTTATSVTSNVKPAPTSSKQEQEGRSYSPAHSWEGIMASEMGIDPALLKSHNKLHKKVHVDDALMKNLENAHPGDNRRQAVFVEEVLASYHMKDLTSKYGSKGKSPKQYFMEAYDNDTRMESNFDNEDNLHHYDSKGREITHPHKKHNHAEKTAAEAKKNKHINRPCSPIVFRSMEDIADSEEKEKSNSTKELASEPNFWASLERLQNEVDDNTVSNLSWCPSNPGSNLFNASRKINTEEKTDTLSSSYDQGMFIMREATLDKYLEPVQEVVQSDAVKRAWERVRQHLDQFNIRDPQAYDMFGKIYEESRDFVKLPEEDVEEFDSGNWEPVPQAPEEIFVMESPEKLFGRFSVYQKAMLYMIEHFEVLRPILAEIKQSYCEVFDKCEKEWRDLDKLRLDQIRLKDTYKAHVRSKDKEGDRALIEVKLQEHALQEHIQWQQHTLYIILGVLWKMRYSLKMQSKLVQKTVVNYKNKVEILAKEIVSQQGNAMYEMALPGKFHEMMEKFASVKDPKEVRRILQAARRQLRKALKQVELLESDYADTIPKTELEPYTEQYDEIHSINEDVTKMCDKIKEDIQKMKDKIADKYKVMARMLEPPSPAESLEDVEDEGESEDEEHEEEETESASEEKEDKNIVT